MERSLRKQDEDRVQMLDYRERRRTPQQIADWRLYFERNKRRPHVKQRSLSAGRIPVEEVELAILRGILGMR